MDKREKVKCYYSEKYNKINKIVTSKIIIIKEDKVILNKNKKFKSNSIRESSIKIIESILKLLNCLYMDNKIDFKEEIEIWARNREIVKSLNDCKNKNIYRFLEKNENCKIRYHKYSNSFVNNFLEKNFKKINKKVVLKSLSDLIDDYENIVFFDLEMNYGLIGEKNLSETIAIGAVKYNINNGCTDCFYSLIKPLFNVKLNEKIIELTKIQQPGIDTAKKFNDIMIKFDKWVGKNKTIFVSWGSVDMQTLKRDNENNGNKINIINIMSDNYVDFQEEFCVYMKSKNCISLINGLKTYNINFDGVQHNPLDDAINLENLALKFISETKLKNKRKIN